MQRTPHAVASLLIAAALTCGVAACGSDDPAGGSAGATSPGGAAAGAGSGSASGGSGASGSGSGANTAKATAPKPKNTTDEAFVRQLVPRDAQVVVVSAQTLRKTKRADIKDIATTVRKAQLEELRELKRIAAKQRLAVDGADTKLDADAKLLHTTAKKLGSASTSAAAAQGSDAAFLDLVIAHHQSWLVLSRAERKYGKDAALKELAAARVKEIRQELPLLKALRDQS